MTNLKHLRALCDAATDGEWTMTNTATAYAIRCNNGTSWNGIAHVNKKLKKPSEANARFIAATDPQTVRALIDEIEKLRGNKVVVDRCEVEGWWEMDCAPRNETLFVCRKKSKPHVTFEAAFFKDRESWEIPEEYLVLQNMTIGEPLDDCWTNYQWKPLITASEGR